MMTELETFIVSLPKAELHLHLEGAVDLDTLGLLARRHGMPDPSSDLYRYTDFAGFLMSFKTVLDHLQDPADYELITERLLRRIAAQGVRCAEIYVAAGVLLWQNKPVEAMFEGIESGYARARADCGIEARWIFDATRQFGAEAAMEVARRAVALRERGVIAIGIGGDEKRGAPELFGEVYDYARCNGMRLTAHAGETTGPESIRGALETLRVERIGHGLSAIQDRQLMETLAEKQIGVDICVSSNVRTGVLREAAGHPLRAYFDAGMLVSLSTDDPAMFETDLVREYVLAHDVMGFTREELARLAQNSFRAAFE